MYYVDSLAGYRIHIPASEEIKDMLIADAALTIGFSLILSGGISSGNLQAFLYYLPIAFVAVSLSFILHEYMHKITAQRFGAIAAFKRSDNGILITLITSALGFLIGLPGATMIYAHNFTEEQEGLVSLAGPLTNFAIFLILFIVTLLMPTSTSKYLTNAISTVLFINIWLAFVNMLPIYPLDGSKVLRWNKTVYVLTIGVVFILLYTLDPTILGSMILVFVIAMFMSFLARNILF